MNLCPPLFLFLFHLRELESGNRLWGSAIRSRGGCVLIFRGVYIFFFTFLGSLVVLLFWMMLQLLRGLSLELGTLRNRDLSVKSLFPLLPGCFVLPSGL